MSRAAALCWEYIKMQLPAGMDACGVNGPGGEQWDLLSRGVCAQIFQPQRGFAG